MIKTVFTSYYARSGAKPQAYSISVTRSRWYPENGHLPLLAPTWDIVRAVRAKEITVDQYIEQYLDLINNQRKLVPQDIADSLNDGDILLCHEKVGDFCHRHVLSDWLRNADITVSEIKKPKDLAVYKWTQDTVWQPQTKSLWTL